MNTQPLPTLSALTALLTPLPENTAYRVFALVDGALLTNLPKPQQRRWVAARAHSLLLRAGKDAIEVGPLLFELNTADLESGQPATLFDEATGKMAGSFIISHADTAELVQRLTALVNIKLADNSEMIMRYFDPRVLPFWLEMLTNEYRHYLSEVLDKWLFIDSSWTPQTTAFEPAVTLPASPELPMRLSGEQEQSLILACTPHTMVARLRVEDAAALSTIPVAQQYAFLQEQIARAETHGVTGQSDVESYCGMAIELGSNFDENQTIKTALVEIKNGKSFIEVMATLTSVDWQRIKGAL
jgi:hypothetical protein